MWYLTGCSAMDVDELYELVNRYSQLVISCGVKIDLRRNSRVSIEGNEVVIKVDDYYWQDHARIAIPARKVARTRTSGRVLNIDLK
jgi:hypothetical protein